MSSAFSQRQPFPLPASSFPSPSPPPLTLPSSHLSFSSLPLASISNPLLLFPSPCIPPPPLFPPPPPFPPPPSVHPSPLSVPTTTTYHCLPPTLFLPTLLLLQLSPAGHIVASQAIELEAHCTKGVGREHAKWSPVATAWYKLKPEVVLLQVQHPLPPSQRPRISNPCVPSFSSPCSADFCVQRPSRSP